MNNLNTHTKGVSKNRALMSSSPCVSGYFWRSNPCRVESTVYSHTAGTASFFIEYLNLHSALISLCCQVIMHQLFWCWGFRALNTKCDAKGIC